ncbi:MAG: hypothetical protein KDI19_08165, partial [Pseudomonadales bacterium]|nr:hypothetical protein [Pseudomonadales bacterium]
MNTDVKPPQILLVDDDQVDRMAVVRSFRKAGINNEIIEAEDGIEALAALGRLHESGVKPKILILLDL